MRLYKIDQSDYVTVGGGLGWFTTIKKNKKTFELETYSDYVTVGGGVGWFTTIKKKKNTIELETWGCYVTQGGLPQLKKI